MKFEHKELGVDFIFPPEITQGELEAFYQIRRRDPDFGPDVSDVETAAASVRAAHEVGWLKNLDISDLDQWKPAKTIWVFLQITKQILEAVTPPKAS